jgi:hypothetical protein
LLHFSSGHLFWSEIHEYDSLTSAATCARWRLRCTNTTDWTPAIISLSREKKRLPSSSLVFKADGFLSDACRVRRTGDRRERPMADRRSPSPWRVEGARC